MAVDIILNGKIIGLEKPTFIIAEIGQNHQGDLNTAKQLIKAAKDSGADCAKFQKTCLLEKFNTAALARSYQCENSWGETYGDHKRFLEFSHEEYVELQQYAHSIGIMFTASAMDMQSLKFLVKIDVPFIKIGSGDANNFILIEEAARTFKTLVISTGMQTFETVQQIYATVSKYHKQFILMHCISAYPTPLEDINLNVIKLYENEFNDIHIGYSGHEMGIDVTPAAVAIGAKVIERHITLDCNQKGSDHKCSLEPKQFSEMVNRIRIVEAALGKPIKVIAESETSCYMKLGKTIVAAGVLRKGHRLKKEDLSIKVAEPKGIDGSLLEDILGMEVNVDVEEDQSLTKHMIQ